MEFQFRTDNNNRAAGVIHALAKQILTETPLLAFQHIGERLQRTVARPCDRTPTATVINEGVHGFLQHALLVANDDIRCTEIEQTLQTIVAVDNAAIEIV